MNQSCALTPTGIAAAVTMPSKVKQIEHISDRRTVGGNVGIPLLGLRVR